jgi:hypothetical protein
MTGSYASSTALELKPVYTDDMLPLGATPFARRPLRRTASSAVAAAVLLSDLPALCWISIAKDHLCHSSNTPRRDRLSLREQ